MVKKKFKDTKVGKFLIGSKGVLAQFADVIPDNTLMGAFKTLITKDNNISKQDKETALELLEIDTIEMKEVTKRWTSDMKSDSWLSKNTRPMSLIFLTVRMVLLILLDSYQWEFKVDDGWVDLLKSLLVTVYVAYFGSRGVEKYRKIKNG